MDEPQAADLAVTLESVLRVLSKDRLVRIGHDFDVAVSRDVTRDTQVRTLLASGRLAFTDLLRSLGRDELKAACRSHALDASGRARSVLARRLAEASDEGETVEPRARFAAADERRRDAQVPQRGDVVQVRQRQYLVDDVTPPPAPGDATLVRLVCLDDDNQGRTVELLWELELGARVIQPEAHGLGRPEQLDPPRLFASSCSTKPIPRPPPRPRNMPSTRASPASCATSRRSSRTVSSSPPRPTTATPTASRPCSRSSTINASPAASNPDGANSNASWSAASRKTCDEPGSAAIPNGSCARSP